MIERDLRPEFAADALKQVERLRAAPLDLPPAGRDLRHLLWASIDNDDSFDLDQLSVAVPLANQRIKILVAIADVDALVSRGTPIDAHAQHNTTSVYTPAVVFPMLPEALCTDLTSLGENVERLAIVCEMVLDQRGELLDAEVYRALVQNRAKLTYHGVTAWLDGSGEIPARVAAVSGMAEQLVLQDRAAQSLRTRRHQHGALGLEIAETRVVFDGDMLAGLRVEPQNRARELIADFMIAANEVSARMLTDCRFPSLRRVVRSPKRWDRIVQIAQEHGYSLPKDPDSAALQAFLLKERKRDHDRFVDLSLQVIKLMGAGEYALLRPNERPPGHFGLAVRDYTHSTAPNRRFPDLITQRLLKAALHGQNVPYTDSELEALALHCTQKEDDANRVERQVRKSAAAMLLQDRIGQRMEGIITGAAQKGTWIRILEPPVEGKVIANTEGLDVGDQVTVKLVDTDVEHGFIDFVRVRESKGAKNH